MDEPVIRSPDHERTPSLSRVYDAINEVRTDVAVIKATLPDIADHETRLRQLERRAWTLAGAATVAGATLAQVVERIFR
jgi:hypothetical protein